MSLTTTSTPIPTGRRAEGGLTKDDVVRIQRGRILFAMAEAVADQGYGNVTVSEVIRRARVSRATFYEQFTDKQDCFLAAFDGALDVLFGGLGPSSPKRIKEDLFPQMLRGYLTSLAEHEAFARVFLIDIYAAGPEGAQRRVESQRRFVELLAAVFGAKTEEEQFACRSLVAAVSSMVTMKVAAGEVDDLMELHEPLCQVAKTLLKRSA